MFSPSYAWNELRRRFGRTLVTALGLAAGVGLVMGIIGVSDGLSDAQNRVLSPLSSVGTDIIVTRTVAPTTSKTTTTTTPTSNFGGAGGGGGGGGGAFFGSGVRGASSLNSADDASLANANSSVLTDLAKLGKPGSKFTHDFFVPGTLITFPTDATSVVAKLPDVTSATGALSLQALHETGTVPDITDTYKTGGQTIDTTIKPPTETQTPAQRAAQQACIQKVVSAGGAKFFVPSTSGSGTSPTGRAGTGAAGTGAAGTGAAGSSGTAGTGRRGTGGNGGAAGFSRFIGGLTSNSAFSKCFSASYLAQEKAYIDKVVVPEQTITRTLNPPTTNTETSSYTVAGVNPSSTSTGLITKAQLTSGTWFTADPTSEVLVNTAYASQKHLKAGGTVTINAKTYKIVGLVNPTLTGDVSDYYFDLSTLQSTSSQPSRINEVLVSVKSSSDVNAVAAEIKKALPGATVLTSKSLANQVTGSLSNAKKLADSLGAALAIVVLIAAILIAALLTMSSVAKRVREIGTLRAIGWTKGEVVRQILAETAGIGIVGGIVGVGIGFLISGIIAAVGPGLSVTSTSLQVGASTLAGRVAGTSNSSSIASVVHLTAPIHPITVVLALAGAIVGGLVAGAIGGWRAARLAPAVALRDFG